MLQTPEIWLYKLTMCDYGQEPALVTVLLKRKTKDQCQNIGKSQTAKSSEWSTRFVYKLQNAAAKVHTITRKFDHITPILCKLPIKFKSVKYF